MKANRIELIYILLCQDARFNNDGTVALGRAILSELKPPFLPSTLAPVCVAFRLRYHAPPMRCKAMVSLEIHHEDGERVGEINGSEFTIALKADQSHADYDGILNLAGVSFHRPGEHYFVLTIDGEPVGKARLRLLEPKRKSRLASSAKELAAV